MLIGRSERVHVEVQVWQGGRPSYNRDGQKVMRTIEAPASYDDGLVFDHQNNEAYVRGRLKLGLPLPLVERDWTDLERFKIARIADELGVENPLEK